MAKRRHGGLGRGLGALLGDDREPVAEIAKRYGLTDNNVMVILSRTRKKLKVHLIKEGFFSE